MPTATAIRLQVHPPEGHMADASLAADLAAVLQRAGIEHPPIQRGPGGAVRLQLEGTDDAEARFVIQLVEAHGYVVLAELAE